MRRLCFVVFAFIISFCAVAMALEDAGVVFSDLSGQVEARPGDDEEAWEFAKIDRKLLTDDHIKTGLDSSAILSFADMSTFVMKPSTEIILSSPTKKESKIKLAAGNIWVNVKKMVKDGTMDIEMSQAVAGIKGTNITCGSNANEDRIQVLRGQAEILIKESRERITLREGEELVVRAGGKAEKTEIDVGVIQEEWKKQLSEMGSSIDLSQVPEVIKEMLQSEGGMFKSIQDEFKSLLGMEKVTEEDEHEFKKGIERFTGTLMEDQLILQALTLKVEKAQSEGQVSPSQMTQIAGYMKMIGGARNTIQGYQNEVSKMLKVSFKKAVTDSAETEQLTAEVAEIWSEVQGVISELSANPTGMGQDWFMDAQSICNETLNALAESSTAVNEILQRDPENSVALALQKQISGYQTEVGQLLRDLAVVEVSPSTLTEMQQLDDTIAASISSLQSKIGLYNTMSTATTSDMQRQLSDSLKILNEFSTARRKYISSQRLYESTMRAASGQKYRTAEQEELQTTFDRISNTYQQLGIVAEQLETELNSLEDQLNTILNK